MMDLSEVNWDFNAAGSWPFQLKAIVIAIVCCLVAGGGVYAFTMDQLAELDALEAKERELTSTFEEKQKKAVSLADYRAQFEEMKALLANMMKQMPTKAQVANLLNEISQTAITSGLEPRLFQPEAEDKKDFYVELPYTIEMIGKYEDLGLFISGLASLSRIVTIHDIDITVVPDAPEAGKPASGVGKRKTTLNMKAIIKTYTEANDEGSD
jgi:type IV pilus assembly protein PilO